VRNRKVVPRVGDCVFGVRSVDGVAGETRAVTPFLPPLTAVVTDTARPPEAGLANPFLVLPILNAPAHSASSHLTRTWPVPGWGWATSARRRGCLAASPIMARICGTPVVAPGRTGLDQLLPTGRPKAIEVRQRPGPAGIRIETDVRHSLAQDGQHCKDHTVTVTLPRLD
jgi:hypothetical protein